MPEKSSVALGPTPQTLVISQTLNIAPIMENQMEKSMNNYMETGIM